MLHFLWKFNLLVTETNADNQSDTVLQESHSLLGSKLTMLGVCHFTGQILAETDLFWYGFAFLTHRDSASTTCGSS